jgi:exo-1,4-beta-D-glucosaminidase
MQHAYNLSAMNIKNYTSIMLAILLISCGSSQSQSPEKAPKKNSQDISLNSGWFIKRASEVNKNGKELSSTQHAQTGWLKSELPSTIMATLVHNGLYQDPYVLQNMEHIPMDSILKPWWLTSTFALGALENNTATLNFDGINYKAQVYLNGTLVADSNQIKGAFNTFKLPVTKLLREGENHLAILLLPPGTGAYSIGFVDWAPTPPDKNMGIWRGVNLKISKEVAMTSTFVQTDLNVQNFSSADLTISTELVNNTNLAQKVMLKGSFDEVVFTHELTLDAHQSKTVTLTPKEVPSLKVNNPKLWWPIGYGEPNLHQLTLSAVVNQSTSSRETVQFGIRKITDYKNKNGHRGYIVNGKKILIKGAGWLDKLFLENDSLYDEQQMQYVVDMNMNCVRFEGFWGKDQHIYDLCDQYGLLAMVGFSCHWEWHDYIGTPCNEDKFGCADEEDEIALIADYWKSQVKYLRNHPSIFSWVGGSDFLPHPELEKKLMSILEKENPSAPYLGAAKWHESEVSGPTGVKMAGPYDYVTPNYWYKDTLRGGAFGFNTETGPGPQPPVYSSLVKMYGQNLHYPIDSTWNFHHGRFAFGTMDKYLKAFNNRYGPSPTLEDFALVSQVASYEAIRPMFEAFRVNQPNTTGVVQWMLNSAWPETFWQLYDFYLQPTGAYFGTKKANEQVQGIYHYGKHQVYLVNDQPTSLASATITTEVYGADSKLLYKMDSNLVDVNPGPHLLFNLRPTKDATEFVFITVTENEGQVHKNNYWLSSKADLIDPNPQNSSWIYTPNISFCDHTALRKMKKIQINQESSNTDEGMTLTLLNDNNEIAFGIQASVFDLTSKKEVAPAIWSDNYLLLKPYEGQKLTVNFKKKPGSNYAITIKGMNIE